MPARHKFREHVMKTLLIFSSFAILAGGIYLRGEYIKNQDAQRRIERLAKRRAENLARFRKIVTQGPLFSISKSTGYPEPVDLIKQFIDKAKTDNIDIWDYYKKTKPDDIIKTSLAYMLVVAGSDDYFSHVTTNINTIPTDEVLLWVTLAEDAVLLKLPETLADKLVALVRKSSAPPSLAYFARLYRQEGLDADATKLYLELLNGDNYYGIVAAMELSDTAHRDKALKYLWKLTDSDNDGLRKESLPSLVEAYEGLEWEEYSRYKINSSTENKKHLIDRLKQADIQDEN